MKVTYRHIIAGLIASAALVQAQISSFTVQSESRSGNDLQIAGVITNQNALLEVSTNCSSPSYSNLSNYLGNYYTLNSGAGGTVLCPQTSSYPDNWTTTLTNTYAPNLGYSSSAPITNCSGRFFIQPGYWSYEWVDEGYYGYFNWIYYPGTQATIQFTVATADTFVLQAVGPSLSNYGLTGLQSPQAHLQGPGGTITSVSGEGSSSGVYLQPGTYTVYVFGADDTNAGVTVVTVYKQ